MEDIELIESIFLYVDQTARRLQFARSQVNKYKLQHITTSYNCNHQLTTIIIYQEETIFALQNEIRDLKLRLSEVFIHYSTVIDHK